MADESLNMNEKWNLRAPLIPPPSTYQTLLNVEKKKKILDMSVSLRSFHLSLDLEQTGRRGRARRHFNSLRDSSGT